MSTLTLDGNVTLSVGFHAVSLMVIVQQRVHECHAAADQNGPTAFFVSFATATPCHDGHTPLVQCARAARPDRSKHSTALGAPDLKEIRMESSLIVVDGYVATDRDDTNLREEAWSFALDQRAFGPRRLLVAFADPLGRFRSLAHARRTDPPEAALGPCIEHVGRGAAAAVAFCDEPVVEGPPPPELAERFDLARSITASYGIHLVDWFACDDQLFRSSRLALDPDGDWWDVS